MGLDSKCLFHTLSDLLTSPVKGRLWDKNLFKKFLKGQITLKRIKKSLKVIVPLYNSAFKISFAMTSVVIRSVIK